jgi:sugar O-acyltransferase (sialic acid O-acetyltransferase NeuD family)
MARNGERGALIVFPCNGNGREALDCVGERYRCVGFVDDDPIRQGTAIGGIGVFDRTHFVRCADAHVLAVPGSPLSYQSRRSVIEGLPLTADRFATVIHPRATVATSASIGRNVLIMAGAVVTSNAVIGDHVCVLPNTVVHHDAVVGAWSLVGSNVTIAGGAIVGENCYVGSGTSVRNGVCIGSFALVGLGSTVVRDVDAHARVAGSPARVLAAPIQAERRTDIHRSVEPRQEEARIARCSTSIEAGARLLLRKRSER